jgi:hypothetical protein
MNPSENQYQRLGHTQICLDYDLRRFSAWHDEHHQPTHHWQCGDLDTRYQPDLLTARQLRITMVSFATLS